MEVKDAFDLIRDGVSKYDYATCIVEGEQARELQDYESAHYYLQKAITLAGQQNNPAFLVEAYAHRFLIYKHQCQNAGDKAPLLLMHAESEIMLSLVEEFELEGHPAAVAYLRAGDYRAFKGEYGTAAQLGKIALSFIDKENFQQYVEFYAHYAHWFALADRSALNLKELLNVLEMVQKVKSIQPVRQMILESGVLLRMADVLIEFKSDDATMYLQRARSIAQHLKDSFGYAQRLVQVENLEHKRRG